MDRRIILRAGSVGAGVQSTSMMLMAEKGLFDDVLDCGIFADTFWEPQGIYANLDWLESELSIPLHRVTNGRSLREDVQNRVDQDGASYEILPLYVRDGNGRPKGLLNRRCTHRYKVEPISKKLRALTGYTGRRIPQDVAIEQWLGISTDEADRMKTNREPWLLNRYPLIEIGFSRRDCLDWFEANYPGRSLSRSACVGCPFHSAEEWVNVKQSDPERFEEACSIDEGLRIPMSATDADAGYTRYLHKRRIPLAEAVALDEVDVEHRRLARNALGASSFFPDDFANECEGHCGL